MFAGDWAEDLPIWITRRRLEVKVGELIYAEGEAGTDIIRRVMSKADPLGLTRSPKLHLIAQNQPWRNHLDRSQRPPFCTP